MLRETRKLSEKYAKANAITLIALIITIIVMLILLAVTISILVKSNIIGIGEQAADKTKTAYEKESKLSEITVNNKTYGDIEDYINGKEKLPETDSKYFEYTLDNNTKTATIIGVKEEYAEYVEIETEGRTNKGNYLYKGR